MIYPADRMRSGSSPSFPNDRHAAGGAESIHGSMAAPINPRTRRRRPQAAMRGGSGLFRLRIVNLPVAVLAVMSFFLMRPAYLGEAYNLAGVALFSSLAFLGLTQVAKADPVAWRTLLPCAILASITHLYIAVLANATSGNAASEGIFSSFEAVSAAIASFGALLLFSHRALYDRISKYFIALLCVLSASSAITYVIAIGTPIENLKLFDLAIKTYGGGGGVYFPFTLIYQLGVYNIDGQIFREPPRANLFLRESGIAQAFLCWAIIALRTRSSALNLLCIACLVAGCLAARSTIGLGLLAVTLAARFFILPRGRLAIKLLGLAIIGPVIIGVGYLALFDEKIGLVAKVGGVSFSDRYDAMAYSWKMLGQNPLGSFAGYDGGRENSMISLIAMAGAIGVIGLLLYLATWIFSIMAARERARKFFSLFPLFVTALVAQPIANAPLFLIFLFTFPRFRPDEPLRSTNVRNSTGVGANGPLPPAASAPDLPMPAHQA